MINIKNKDLNSSHIGPVLRKLGTFTGFPADTCYWVGRMVDQVDRRVRHITEVHTELCRKYIKNNKGVPEVDSRGMFIYNDEKAKEAFDVEFKKLMEEPLEIKGHKIKLAAFEGAGVTPDEMNALHWLIDMVDTPKLELKRGGNDGEKG